MAESNAAPIRIAVAALSLSFAGFVGLVGREWFTERAIVPTKGDVPTLGFGSTVYEDGTPVRMGDTITPVRAIQLAQSHISKDEAAFRASLPGVSLTQAEYDLYLDFTYQYGIGNWRASSMRRNLLETPAATPADIPGLYRAACDALLAYRFAGGYDCSTTINGKRNTRCWGVWDSQLKRHARCVAEQGGMQ